MAPLTDEEHEARAMLLGAKWKSWLHCYVFEKPAQTLALQAGMERWLDGDTLEELTGEQKFNRLNNSLKFK